MDQARRKRRRSCLGLADWPPGHRLLWDTAVKPGSKIRPGGPASKWAPDTRRMRQTAYGEWLYWLRGQTDDWATAAPADLITEERFLAFLDDMALHVSTSSVALRSAMIRQAIDALMPDRDWSWLHVIVRNVVASAGEGRDKRSRLVHARELFKLGLRLVVQAEEDPDLSPRQRAILYRDGLLIAFLANRPLRKRNVRNMVLGQTFVREDDLYWLRFPKTATKTRRAINIYCVNVLTPLFDRYFGHHRKEFLRRGGLDAADAVWISGAGQPMGDVAIWRAVTGRTHAEFGRSVNPHLFRDCVATTIAIDDPAHIQAAMVILGHTTLAMVERHYNLAGAVEAHRALQAVMEGNESDAPQPYERPAIPVFPKVRRYGRSGHRRRGWNDARPG